MQPGSYTIAVVEDDSSLAKAVVRLLQAAGYMAFSCASAEEFLAEPRGQGADFLALDIDLPGMSGIDLQEKLSESQPARPIAFMTALDEPGIREQAEQGGCVAYLRKPFQSEELLGAIRKALGVANAPLQQP
jgi:FixJ family two-component response regulator